MKITVQSRPDNTARPNSRTGETSGGTGGANTEGFNATP